MVDQSDGLETLRVAVGGYYILDICNVFGYYEKLLRKFASINYIVNPYKIKCNYTINNY